MAIKTSKYKKVLTKKLSSTVILLILLALGVFAVVFNRFYLSPRAMMIGEGAGGGNTSSNYLRCTTSKICVRTYGANYECVSNRCAKKKVAPKPPSVVSTFPTCSYQNGRYLDPVTNKYVYISPSFICTQPNKYIKYTKSQCVDSSVGPGVDPQEGEDYYVYCLPTNCSNIGLLDDPSNSNLARYGYLSCISVSITHADAQNRVDSNFKCNSNQDCVSKYGMGYICNLTDTSYNSDSLYGMNPLNRCYYVGG